MNILADRILPLSKKVCRNIVENHIKPDENEIDEQMLDLVEHTVWEIVTLCLGVRNLPEISGRTLWIALSFPGETQEDIANILNRGLYKEEKTENKLDKENVKKHIFDAMKKVKDCVMKGIKQTDWTELINNSSKIQALK